MKSTDEGVTIPKAKEAISEMKTVEEIKAYIEGDERKGVVEFAAACIAEIEEAAGKPDGNGSDSGEETIATSDCFRYHKEHEPRIFRKGDKIPADWTMEDSVVKSWRNTAEGKWQKVG